MALPPQKFREIVFQILYSIEIGNPIEDDLVPFLMKELSTTKKNILTAWERAQIVQQKFSKLDALITEVSTEYRFERIQKVEKNILRLAVYELFFDKEIPPKVSISEGMRLAKKFGSPEASNFVNAILDAIYKKETDTEFIDNEIENAFTELIEREEKNKNG